MIYGTSMNPGDLVIVNDDTWLYGGESYLEFIIKTTIKKGTLGFILDIQEHKDPLDDQLSVRYTRVSFPGWIGWVHSEYIGVVR